MKEEIRAILLQYTDDTYKEFSASLVPGAKPLLGVRLPQLRTIAKDIVKKGTVGDWRDVIVGCGGENEDIYFEETMLRGMIIGYGTAPKEISCKEGMDYLERFIPQIDNWSVCDSFCNSFHFANRYRDEVWEFMQPYLYSDKEFEVRTAVILLLSQYLKYDKDNKKIPRNRYVKMEDILLNASNEKQSVSTKQKYPYLEKILKALNREFKQGYYAQMAAAWTLAESFVCFPYETWRMLAEDCMIDSWTYNKALQKIRESRNPDKEVKEFIKNHKISV